MGRGDSIYFPLPRQVKVTRFARQWLDDVRIQNVKVPPCFHRDPAENKTRAGSETRTELVFKFVAIPNKSTDRGITAAYFITKQEHEKSNILESIAYTYRMPGGNSCFGTTSKTIYVLTQTAN